jgi:hypothetical protein
MLKNAAPQSIVSVKKQLDKVLALKGRQVTTQELFCFTVVSARSYCTSYTNGLERETTDAFTGVLRDDISLKVV